MRISTDWRDATRAHRVVVCEGTPSGLPTVDYADAFAMARRPGDERTLEALVRGSLGTPPAPARRIMLAAWRILGFQLGHLDSPHHILGWRIERSDDQVLQIAADGRYASSRITARDRGDLLVTTTFLAFSSRRARLAWVALSPVHRRMARYLMDSAGR